MSSRLLGFLMLWLLSASVHAHTLSVAHVDVSSRQGQAGVVLEIDVALRDLALTMPLDSNGDNAITWGELRSQRPALERLLLQHVQLRSSSSTCKLQPQALGTRSYDGVAYASMSFISNCAAGTGLAIAYDLIFDQDPAHRAIVAWRLGDNVQTNILQADARSARLTATGANDRSGTFMQFLSEGIHHILGGIDHLAFLLALLLPAVLVRQDGRWQPTPRIGGSLRTVAGVVTAFTLAHSITLSLAALGMVRPNGQIVEVVIAASVLLAALNNIKPVVTGRVWLVALGFGLIHGMGFARALQDLGLPQGQELSALLGFNLGVELGQLGVVALVFPILAAVRRKAWYARVAMPLLSVLIAVAALYWIGQRVSG